MVFCNEDVPSHSDDTTSVTILILIDGFLQYKYGADRFDLEIVTILILIDGFLQ